MIWLHTATVFEIDGGNISLSCSVYKGLLIIGGQTDIHTAEPLVPEPSAFDVQMAIEKLKRHNSPGIYQIPAELIKAGGRTSQFDIHKLFYSIWNKEEFLRSGKSRSFYLFIRRAIKEIVVIIEEYQFRQLNTRFYPPSCCQG